VHRVLVGKPEGKRPLERPTRKWEDNINMRVWGRIEVCTGCWWKSLRERGHWGDQDLVGKIILRWIFRKLEGVVGTRCSWLRMGTFGGHLWVR
jgi:hypothetical protein